jgi:hypothetical protein
MHVCTGYSLPGKNACFTIRASQACETLSEASPTLSPTCEPFTGASLTLSHCGETVPEPLPALSQACETPAETSPTLSQRGDGLFQHYKNLIARRKGEPHATSNSEI